MTSCRSELKFAHAEILRLRHELKRWKPARPPLPSRLPAARTPAAFLCPFVPAPMVYYAMLIESLENRERASACPLADVHRTVCGVTRCPSGHRLLHASRAGCREGLSRQVPFFQ